MTGTGRARTKEAAPPAWSEKQTELVIGRLLQAGVILAATIVLLGGVMYLARGGEPAAHYRIFNGEREDLRTVSGVLHDLPHRRWRAVIQLGLLLLIATPIARVVFSIFAFALEKDYLYVGITTIVLVILMYSLMGHYG
jgi:uncharacterized membrane protein